MKKVKINSEFITLGQFLKFTGIVSTGGMVKPFLSEEQIYVNEEEENRRGKKLYPGSKIKIKNIGEFIIENK